MTTTAQRAKSRVRLGWLMRRWLFEVRGHGAAHVVGAFAFAIATFAAALGAFGWSAWRAGTGSAAGGASAAGAELVAFLREDLPPAFRDDLALVLRRLPGVSGVRVLGSDEALERMRTELGDRASVLDGVEEGFLPATLEVSLQPGREGAGRADAVAWRLRRMEGITDVDILRTATDQRLARADGVGRRLGGMGLLLGVATALLAMGLAATAMRRSPGDARLLSGLGFTNAAIAAPATIAGAVCACAGTLLGGCLLLGARSLAEGAGLDGFVTAPGGGPQWWPLAATALVTAVVVGAAMGWWGARPSPSSLEDHDLVAAD